MFLHPVPCSSPPASPPPSFSRTPLSSRQWWMPAKTSARAAAKTQLEAPSLPATAIRPPEAVATRRPALWATVRIAVRPIAWGRRRALGPATVLYRGRPEFRCRRMWVVVMMVVGGGVCLCVCFVWLYISFLWLFAFWTWWRVRFHAEKFACKWHAGGES